MGLQTAPSHQGDSRDPDKSNHCALGLGPEEDDGELVDGWVLEYHQGCGAVRQVGEVYSPVHNYVYSSIYVLMLNAR